MATIQSSGQSIFFEESGSGIPIVLGHSFLCTGAMWRGQVDTLASRYRVINIDFRGHGRSGPAARPFTLYDAVEDVIAVLDHLGLEQAVWCGLSIGGMVSMRAALTHPERVSALVLMDTDAGAEILLRKLKYGAMGVGVKAFGTGPFLSAISNLMFGTTTLRENPSLVNEWRDIFAAMHVPSALAGLDALVSRDSLLDRLQHIQAPSLVMVGDEDRSLPPPVSQRIHAGLTNSQYIEVPGAGHLSALEQPEQVNEAISRFLNNRLA